MLVKTVFRNNEKQFAVGRSPWHSSTGYKVQGSKLLLWPQEQKTCFRLAAQSEKHINQKACLHFHIMSQQSLGTFLLTLN